MSLRDLASGPSCAPDNSQNALSKAADLLFPQSSRNTLSQAASSATHAEQALLHNDLPLQDELPQFSVPQHPPPELIHPHLAPFPHFAPPLPTGVTARFEAAFRDVAPMPQVAHPPPPQMLARPFVADFVAQSEAQKLATEFERTALRGNASRTMPQQRMMFRPGANIMRVAMLAEERMRVQEEKVAEKKEEVAQREEDETKSWGEEFTSLEEGWREDMLLWDDDDRYGMSLEMMMNTEVPEMDILQGRYDLGQDRQSERSGREALELGIRLRVEGKLREAIDMLEEALRKEVELEEQEILRAWYLLGVSLMESDDDIGAIKALREGRQKGGGEEFLAGLAVCYTNEMRGGEAMASIKEWFKGRGGVGELEDGLKEMGDVESCMMLGVLYNLRREYEGAAAVFRKAVSMRENEGGLWNKLGATLANWGRREEALRAYRRAVDLNPGMIRAWVNVGTAYVNGGEVGKGVRYYVRALGMGGERLEHVWGYLKTGVVSLGRADLVEAVERKDLEAVKKALGV